jgi:hypothetical protein
VPLYQKWVIEIFVEFSCSLLRVASSLFSCHIFAMGIDTGSKPSKAKKSAKAEKKEGKSKTIDKADKKKKSAEATVSAKDILTKAAVSNPVL